MNYRPVTSRRELEDILYWITIRYSCEFCLRRAAPIQSNQTEHNTHRLLSKAPPEPKHLNASPHPSPRLWHRIGSCAMLPIRVLYRTIVHVHIRVEYCTVQHLLYSTLHYAYSVLHSCVVQSSAIQYRIIVDSKYIIMCNNSRHTGRRHSTSLRPRVFSFPICNDELMWSDVIWSDVMWWLLALLYVTSFTVLYTLYSSHVVCDTSVYLTCR